MPLDHSSDELIGQSYYSSKNIIQRHLPEFTLPVCYRAICSEAFISFFLKCVQQEQLEGRKDNSQSLQRQETNINLGQKIFSLNSNVIAT